MGTSCTHGVPGSGNGTCTLGQLEYQAKLMENLKTEGFEVMRFPQISFLLFFKN